MSKEAEPPGDCLKTLVVLNIWSGYSFGELFLEACMGKDIRADYNQIILLPPSLED
jgi:hypothetical protein